MSNEILYLTFQESTFAFVMPIPTFFARDQAIGPAGKMLDFLYKSLFKSSQFISKGLY